MRSDEFSADVCVIGAGIAGLSAAEYLVGSGLKVEVLEAQSKVGGRIKDARTLGGAAVELGANWFSATQQTMSEKIERYKVDVVATYNQGVNMFLWAGERASFVGAIPRLSSHCESDLDQAMIEFDKCMKLLDGKDSSGVSIKDFDKFTFGQWIQATLKTKTGQEFFHWVSEMVFGVESFLVSFLYVLSYSKKSDSLTSLISVNSGHQEYRFKNGPLELCEKIADYISDKQIVLNTPVRKVSELDQGVLVESDSYQGLYRAVICAAPPPSVKKIRFNPPLSAKKERLLQSMPMGRVIKIQVVFERPYWIELGMSGQSMCDEFPLAYTIDNSPVDQSVGILAGFVRTSHADGFMALGVNQNKLIVESLRRIFGEGLPDPTEIYVEDWAKNEWIGGSYGAYFPPGIISKNLDVIEAQSPPVFWCGAEYGSSHPCQMEGALVSGQKVARNVETYLK